MAIQNKISIETRFQLNNTIKNFKFTDDTDYASEGIAPSDVLGAFVITDPSGGTVQSTILPAYDIDNNVSSIYDTRALPLDANGDVITGNYTIKYTIRVAGAVQPGDYSETFIYNFCYTVPDVVIDVAVNLIDAKITSTDNTVFPSTLVSSALTHTLTPPNGVNTIAYPPSVVATTVNYYTPIFTKTWTAKVSNVLVFKESDDLYIDDTIIGDVEKNIIDGINICKLQCNLRSLGDRYASALRFNPINADRIAKEQLTPALFNAFMYRSNIECGNFEKAEEYYAKVIEFTGAQPDCSCSNSDVPTLITATSGGGSGGNFVVAVSGNNNALTVTAVTVGNTTTYTLLFNQVMFDKITALELADIISTDGSVTVTSALVGYTRTFDLAVPMQQSKFIEVLMVFSSGSLPTYSIVNQKKYGTDFKTTITSSGIAQLIDVQNIGSAIAWQGNYAKLVFQNFFSGAAVAYYPEIYSIEEINNKALLTGTDVIAVPKKLTPFIYSKSGTDKFWVKFINPTGGVCLGKDLDVVQNLRLIIKLNS